MRASRRSSGRARVAPGFEKRLPFLALPPLATTLRLLSPVSHPSSPCSLILSRSSFTHEEWSPFVCPVGPTPAHVYRRRESDTFARMLKARESSEKKKGLRLNEILPSSN